LIGPSKTQGATISRSQRNAPRKVRVRQWPCGAKPRRRWPFSPAAQRGHVGLDPGLVDEDQPPGSSRPARPASAAAPGDVGAGLLKGEQRFF
jgi:hypothetical protein